MKSFEQVPQRNLHPGVSVGKPRAREHFLPKQRGSVPSALRFGERIPPAGTNQHPSVMGRGQDVLHQTSPQLQ